MEERKDNFYGDDDAFYIEINDGGDGTYSSLDGGYSSFGEAENIESDNSTSSSANNDQPTSNDGAASTNESASSNTNQMPTNSTSNSKPTPQPPKKPIPRKPVIRVVPKQTNITRATTKQFDWGAFLMGVGAGFMLKLFWDAMRKGKKRK